MKPFEVNTRSLCFTCLWIWLHGTRKVMLHYEHAKTKDIVDVATMCFELNKRRKYLGKYRSKDSTKKERKIIRAERKGKAVKQKKSPGTVCIPGCF